MEAHKTVAKKQNQSWREDKRVMYGYIALFVLALIYVDALFYNSVRYEDRIYPGIKIAGTDVGGETREEAARRIAEKVKSSSSDIVLKGSHSYTFSKEDLGVAYDIPKTVDHAFSIGRDNDLNPIKKYHEDVPLAVNLDSDKVTGALMDVTQKENRGVEDASVFMRNGKLQTEKEQIGKRVLLGENVRMIQDGLSGLDDSFNLKIRNMDPAVTGADINSAKDQIQNALSQKLVLQNVGEKYVLNEKDIAGFLSFQSSSSSSLAYATNFSQIFPNVVQAVRVSYDRKAIRDWAVRFSGHINQDPKNAKLAMNEGGLTVVASSKDGVKVNAEELTDRIKDALVNQKQTVDVPVDTIKPEVSSDNLDKLGLKELVSTGWTDFSGSPANRIHNIQVGAAKFNGVLIKPGEDFSFDDTLGNVDASTGYLPELVILKDKTVPEYGGGLCQVSSTAFRAALNAGLPILERAAHAYPVGYYKPYGVDATIYLPSPDLIFKNDTPGYILIQTRIAGNKLYFDFYGTKKPGSIKFAGDENATQGVSSTVEGITPTITEQDARGPKSFTATFYRFIYDTAGNLIKKNYWVSKYDSPDKYPH